MTVENSARPYGQYFKEAEASEPRAFRAKKQGSGSRFFPACHRRPIERLSPGEIPLGPAKPKATFPVSVYQALSSLTYRVLCGRSCIQATANQILTLEEFSPLRCIWWKECRRKQTALAKPFVRLRPDIPREVSRILYEDLPDMSSDLLKPTREIFAFVVENPVNPTLGQGRSIAPLSQE